MMIMTFNGFLDVFAGNLGHKVWDLAILSLRISEIYRL